MHRGTTAGRTPGLWTICGLVVALGSLPPVLAAETQVFPEGKVHPGKTALVLATPESAPVPGELYHNDLTPGSQVQIPGQTTAMHGDAITLATTGAGLVILEIEAMHATQADIPGHCSASGLPCTGSSGQCPGTDPKRCTRSGTACSTSADCPTNSDEGRSYEYCDTCLFDADWVTRFRLYDRYDPAASPVNSGLLTTKYRNVGGVWQATNNVGWVFDWPGGLTLSDRDVFYTLEQKLVPFGGSNQVTDAQFDAAPWNLGGSWNFRGGGPPERGRSDAGSYVDRDGDGRLDAADRVTGYSVAGCPGGTCQANDRLFVRGPRIVIDCFAQGEFYTIAGNGDSYLDLSLDAGAFDYDDSGFEDCTGGLGTSAGLTQRVVLEGREIANSETSVPAINAIFEHGCVVLPGTTPYTLTAFSAGPKGGVPIFVTRDGGAGGISTEEWELSVCHGGIASTGTETASLGACGPTPTEPGQGGPISMTLNLRPRLTFVKRTDPRCVVTIERSAPVPMTSEAFQWNDTPSYPIIVVGDLVGFDKSCDGTVDSPPVGGSASYHWFPGTFVPRCAGDLSCTPAPPVTRVFRFAGPGWGIAFHEAVATVGLPEATDTDGDGVLDGADDCDFVFDPGQVDSDGDGIGDLCQVCPCGAPHTDTDLDGTPDCIDGCPNDPTKLEPGICGCGLAETDWDGDGTPNCHDGCPGDPGKIDPGICGCGVPDSDSDGDGVADCVDNCPTLSNSDQADSNQDGIGDVCDGCPDADHDGICELNDACPSSILDPTVVIPPAGAAPPPGAAPGTFLRCDTGVPNFLLVTGCTLSDEIAACDASSRNHGQFDKCVKALLNRWKRDHIITERQRKAIDKCVKRYQKRDLHARPAGSAGSGAVDF